MPDRSLRLHPLPPEPFASGPQGSGYAAALPGTPRSVRSRDGRHATVRIAPCGFEGAPGPAGPGALRVPGPGGSHGTHDTEESPRTAPGWDAPGGAPQGVPGPGGSGEPDRPTGGLESEQGGQQDNPYAPPPEGAPDRPWRPRRLPGSGPRHAAGSRGRSDRPADWDQWSDQQPGRAQGGRFGERPRGQGGPEGRGDRHMRWDPTDPAQRRARYALLSGMWAFFFALFSWRELALLLGALALYWGVSSLRNKPRRPDLAAANAAGTSSPASEEAADDAAAGSAGFHSGGRGGGVNRPQITAAVCGLVTAGLALVMIATTFTARLVYSDYYTCMDDALTTSAEHSCEHLLPDTLHTLLDTDS